MLWRLWVCGQRACVVQSQRHIHSRGSERAGDAAAQDRHCRPVAQSRPNPNSSSARSPAGAPTPPTALRIRPIDHHTSNQSAPSMRGFSPPLTSVVPARSDAVTTRKNVRESDQGRSSRDDIAQRLRRESGTFRSPNPDSVVPGRALSSPPARPESRIPGLAQARLSIGGGKPVWSIDRQPN